MGISTVTGYILVKFSETLAHGILCPLNSPIPHSPGILDGSAMNKVKILTCITEFPRIAIGAVEFESRNHQDTNNEAHMYVHDVHKLPISTRESHQLGK